MLNKDVEWANSVSFIPWDKLKNKTLFITGATGLIGTELIRVLDYINQYQNLNLTLLALVRDESKARKKFEKILQNGSLKLVVGSIEHIPALDIPVDYIIHGASQTASKEFVTHAVETIKTSVLGTMSILELAQKNKVEAFVFLSTMEIYGTPQTDEKITEEHSVEISNPINVRSCYPISKIMSENLCIGYYTEYAVPVKIVRLTQTFGTGVTYNDGRVFAEFARCVVEKKDIVLRTKGTTKRSYVSVRDAVSAIITVMLSGASGEVYNVANEKTYCTILDMALLVSEKIANKEISVVFDIDENIEKFGYAPPLHMNLDVDKLRSLGWQSTQCLEEMFVEILEEWTKNKN